MTKQKNPGVDTPAPLKNYCTDVQKKWKMRVGRLGKRCRGEGGRGRGKRYSTKIGFYSPFIATFRFASLKIQVSFHRLATAGHQYIEKRVANMALRTKYKRQITKWISHKIL